MLTIYNGSFDPPHTGHLNTYLKAQKLFGNDIAVCICVNHLKDGLLSIEDRLHIARSLFPTTDIRVYQDRESIIQLMTDADKIVRGYRDQMDIEETMKIAKYYGVESMKQKLAFIKIDPEYSDISSTDIKRRFSSDKEYLKRALNNTGLEVLSKALKDR